MTRKTSYVNPRGLVDTTQVEMMETQAEAANEDGNGGAPSAAPAGAPAGAPGPAEEARRHRPRLLTKEEEDVCPCGSQRGQRGHCTG